MNVLIIGGYGQFGSRLANLLADESGVHLLIAGRRLPKAQAFCDAWQGAATATPVVFDRSVDVEAQCAQLKEQHDVDVVVDASGPFQCYGDAPYAVVEACIHHGIHYLDLADGADFVLGIAQFDEAAKAAGVLVMSGLSTLPALSSAALDALCHGDRSSIVSVTTGIAPSPKVTMGLSVIQAILSYAGKPLTLLRDGDMHTAHGLTESQNKVIAPPGACPLRPRCFALVDVPDLQLLQQHYPNVRDVWVGAGTKPQWALRLLMLAAAWVKRGWLRDLLPWAKWMHGWHARLSWGEHRGGMFVEAVGHDTTSTWHLVAEGDCGPNIPVMGMALMLKKLLTKQPVTVGAGSSLSALTLAEFQTMFRRFDMTEGMTEKPNQTSSNTSPYQTLLGAAWHRLPVSVQAMHQPTTSHTVSGEASVTHQRTMFGHIVARVIGFPQATPNTPVRVHFDVHNGVEHWQRDFGGQPFSSLQYLGSGKNKGLMVEQFGLLKFGLAVLVDDSSLRLKVRRWTCLGVPLPLALAPTTEAKEYEQDGRFHFDVAIRHPWFGLLVHYRGWLQAKQ